MKVSISRDMPCMMAKATQARAPTAIVGFRPKRSAIQVTKNRATTFPAGYTEFMAPSKAPSGLPKYCLH